MAEEKFQSLIGKLQTKKALQKAGIYKEFQSLIGKLQTLLMREKEYKERMFQSLIGKLQTKSKILTPIKRGMCFNPL